MRNILTTILLLAALTVVAQNYSPCYKEKYEAGVALYNKGDYNGAKAKFVASKSCPMPNTVQADEWIKKCNAKIVALKKTQEYTIKGIAFKMVFVEGGTFKMGNDNGTDSEKPVHSVTLNDFYIGETEVTQSLWEAVMGTTVKEQQRLEGYSSLELKGEGPNYPMYYVNWNEAVEFCNKLNYLLRSKLPLGYRFSLPTEAQWEYAARGGNKSKGYKYAGSNNVDEVAWYGRNSGDRYLSGYLAWDTMSENHCRTHQVKNKLANELGLYDMSGNVSEWCLDWCNLKDYYKVSPSKNPQGPSSGDSRVFRGGNYWYEAWDCRATKRNGHFLGRFSIHGFRLALTRQ